MRRELSSRRPSALSLVFRHHAADVAEGGSGRLADWTRHIDGDWRFYCPVCNQIVILIEEKLWNAKETAWTVTRRAATRHEDRPYGWKVTVNEDGTFTMLVARNNGGHDAFGPVTVDEDRLIRYVEDVFDKHYAERGHRRAA